MQKIHPRLSPRRLVWACLAALAFMAAALAGGTVRAGDAAGPNVTPLSHALRMGELSVIFRDEGQASAADLATGLLGDARPQGWEATVAQIYDPTRLHAEFDAGLSQALRGATPADVNRMARFFTEGVGARATRAEVAARRTLLDPTAEAAAKEAWARMVAAHSLRVALLQRMAQASDLIDANVQGTLNADLAFYRAMGAAAHPDRPPSDADLLAQIAQQEGDVRRSTEEWLFPFMALAYRDLSDADVLAYTEFAESQDGQRLNRAMFAAFDTVYRRISAQMGRAVAQALIGQNI